MKEFFKNLAIILIAQFIVIGIPTILLIIFRKQML